MQGRTILVTAAIFLSISASNSVFASAAVYRNVGAVRVALPAPKGFTGECARDQVLSRLIAAMSKGDLEILASYLTVTDCQAYLRGTSSEWFSPYLLVQVDRRVMYRELSSAFFQEFRRVFKADHANMFDHLRPELQSLLESPNKALSDVAGINMALAVGEIGPLGVFAESATKLSAALLMKQRYTLGNITKEHLQVCTMSLVFVRGKVLFLYVYGTYGSNDDLQSVKHLTTRWVDQVLAAN